jgi:hypothetical protein
MHHITGVAVVAIGVLLLADRVTQHRFRVLEITIAVVWIVLGAFLFIRADPEGWPMGASLRDSLGMSAVGEWIQHKVLSLIPVLLGCYAAMRASERTNAGGKLF